MQTKVEPVFLYKGLGFHIKLENIEMVNIGGEWHPKIDVHDVADKAIRQLAFQETALIGNQVKFVRSYFSLPIGEFAEQVAHESQSDIIEWEINGNEPTNMKEHTKQVLQLYIIEQTQTRKQL